MALAIDSGPVSGTAGSGSPHNVVLNNAAGTILFGLAGLEGGTTDTINGQTYNSLSLTEITAVAQTVGSFRKHAKIYVRSSPSTGSNTLATTYSSAFDEENETAISFTGQDGVTPYTTLTPVTVSAGTSISLDFSGMAAGDIGLVSATISDDAAGAALTSPSISGGTTLNSSYSGAFNGSTFWTAKVTTPGTVTLSWTGNFNAVIAGVIVKQASASTPASTASPRARTIKTDRTMIIEGGRQRSFSPRRAMSGTRKQESFSTATVANSTFSSVGDSTATFLGAATDNSVLSAPGSATATFVGASKAASVLAAAGDSAATFVGASLAKSVLSAAGDSTATFTGAAKANSVLSAAADSTATFTGSSKASAVLSATGDSTASFTGASQAASTLAAAGDSTASFIGRSDASAVWNAAADASCSWIGATGGNALSAPGDSSAIFVGAALAAAVLAAVAEANASFISQPPSEDQAPHYYGHKIRDDRDDVQAVLDKWEFIEKQRNKKPSPVSEAPARAAAPAAATAEPTAPKGMEEFTREELELLSIVSLALFADRI